MPEIVVESLGLSFGANQVLNDVGFTVHDREFLTLLGPSGCGKTTTLMSVAGFLRPDTGAIRCGERTFFDDAAKVCLAAEDRNIGIVFQSYAIWPHMTVFDNVAFPLAVRKVKRAARRTRVMETLALVEMADYAGRYPHELSGGQQQRVALARALVYAPSVLLLDEPFSNLDAKLRERARTWLMGLQRELGLTTLFVTHDQDEALSLSDRIAVMSGGSILQIGAPEEIYRRPEHRFVAEFLGHCNILTGHVARIQGTDAVIEIDGTRQALTVPVGIAELGDRLEVVVRPEAIGLSEADPEPGLEPDSEPGPDQPAARGNTYRAKVQTVAFLGDHYVYELDLAGIPLTVTHAHSLRSAELTVHIPTDACRTIPAVPAAADVIRGAGPRPPHLAAAHG